jgi:hypothetical protein
MWQEGMIPVYSIIYFDPASSLDLPVIPAMEGSLSKRTIAWANPGKK